MRSKQEQRRKLAELPFEQKFRLVAELRRVSDVAVRKHEFGGFCDLTLQTFVVLQHAVDVLLPKADEPPNVARCLAVGVLSAFVLEAYLNHIGQGLLTSWSDVERRLSPKEKLALISELLQITIDRGRLPFQLVDEILSFRNMVAHGKTEMTTVRLPDSVTSEFLQDLGLGLEPLRSANRETVSRWASAVTEMIRFLHAAYVPRARSRGLKETEDPFELVRHGPIYSGPLPK